LLSAAAAFLRALQEATKRFGWRVGAHVVMSNHFHLPVQTPESNLSAGTQWWQVTFASQFNRMRNQQGHLFQGRSRSICLAACRT